MALIKCSECGKQVSDKAASCPNCGAPIKAMNNDTIMIQIDRDPSQPFLGTIVDIKESTTGKVLVSGKAGSVLSFKSKKPIYITFNIITKKGMCPTLVSPQDGGKYKATWSAGLFQPLITSCFPVDNINAY